MALFQSAVLKTFIERIKDSDLENSWSVFTAHFHNPEIQDNIRNSKEEEYQSGFLNDLFVKILGYTKYPASGYNLRVEQRDEKGSKKADGALLVDDKVVGIIELKGTDTTDLDKVEQQAFGYKNYHRHADYVVISNFEKLRFYIDNAVDYNEFNLFELTKEEFKVLWLCLEQKNFEKGIPKKIKEASLTQNEEVTKKLYADYSAFKDAIFKSMVEHNTDYDKLRLFKKTQKLLDRFLFIFFAEDQQLLPPNSIRKIIQQWQDLREEYDMDVTLFDRFKKYFGYLNTGHKGKEHEIFPYNGGLFADDDVLDNITIDDDLLYKHALQLSHYDFASEVDVNILGHIFEHSLNEIEEITAELEGQKVDTSKTRRKKDGVYYTPKYITQYIVENTVGKLCKEKKSELGIEDEEYIPNRQKATKKKLLDMLETYRGWLLKLTICDPACGSGAFLNQALEFLIAEHHYVDELQAKLLEESIVYPDVKASILENNLFGVDINEESVEIAKLSLWLRTAQKGRKLTSLNNNIKCGNSLIDDPEVAGGKAFKWEEEFPGVFKDGGFDVVIGNPPYGAYLDNDSKQFLSSNYETFQGNHEIYFFFIELTETLIKNLGKIGFITPDTWINIPQAKKLREFTLRNFSIDQILTFGQSVFADASVNAIVFILQRGSKRTSCEVIHIDKSNFDQLMSAVEATFLDVNRWDNSDDKQFQIWQNDLDISIINKMKTNTKAGEEYLDVSQGIVPYSTENLTKEEVKAKIFHSDRKEGDDYGPWIQGRSINRFGVDLSDKQYLKYGDWLHRSREKKYFEGKRILIQEITGGTPPRICASIHDKILYHNPGIITCLNISKLSTEYILGIINSKLLSWYHLKTSPKGKRTTFPKVLIGDIRNFPIKEPARKVEESIKSLVQDNLELVQSLLSLEGRFNKLLLSKFDNDKLSRKLQSWHDLTFKQFLAELKKKKVTLSLKKEAEWMEYFNEQKAKAEELKSQIAQTDKKIDAIVYDLYGLSEDEVRIVEGS